MEASLSLKVDQLTADRQCSKLLPGLDSIAEIEFEYYFEKKKSIKLSQSYNYPTGFLNFKHVLAKWLAYWIKKDLISKIGI